MNTVNAGNASLQMSDVMMAARKASQLSILMGVMLVALGIFSVMAPMISGIAVTMLIGAYLIVAGGIETYYAFKAPSFGKGALQFLFGGVGILAGIVTFAMPVASLQTLTMILAGLFVVGGIVEISLALRMKKEEGEGWGWMMFNGGTSILLAILIFAQWPLSGLWAIGVLVGARLMIHGFTLISLGNTGKEMLTYSKDVRVDVLEEHLRATTKALQETQVALAEQTLVLLALGAELGKKVSTEDVDPRIREFNEMLGEVRTQMHEVEAETMERWSEAQRQANVVFEGLQESAAELTERLKSELG